MLAGLCNRDHPLELADTRRQQDQQRRDGATSLLFSERKKERDSVLGAHRARDVSLTLHVFGQQDMAGMQPDLGSVADLDLPFFRQGDDVLATWALGQSMKQSGDVRRN